MNWKRLALSRESAFARARSFWSLRMCALRDSSYCGDRGGGDVRFCGKTESGAAGVGRDEIERTIHAFADTSDAPRLCPRA